MKDPAFLESIYVASPVLYADCCKWKKDTDSIKPSREKKLFVSLAKYYMRMSTRSTPFGLFSGCSLTEWENELSPESGNSIFSRSTRLDMHCICLITEWICRQPLIKTKLTYHPNSSLYPVGQTLRFTEYVYRDGYRKYQLSSVPQTEYLLSLMQTARDGASYEKLLQQLQGFGVSILNATEYLNELIDSQVLVSNLELAITGGDPLQRLLRAMRSILGLADDAKGELLVLIQELEIIVEMVNRLDDFPVNDIVRYEEIATRLAKFELPFEPAKLFQVDLVTGSISQGLSQSIQKDLLAAVEICSLLAETSSSKCLQTFQQAFTNRYGTEERNLLEILDEECGIRYGNNEGNNTNDEFLKTIPRQSRSLKWTPITQFLFDKALAAVSAGKQEINISLEEAKSVRAIDNRQLPPSMAIMFRVSDQSNGPGSLYFERATGASALNMLARFGYSDKAIADWCMDLAATEEKYNPGIRFAEIVHLPERRTGNILLHPPFRKYEIPYLASSALPKEQQVAAADLAISVNAGKIILRDKRTGNQIIPRLSTAHNYKRGVLPIYEFLGDLQHQNLHSQIAFSWGALEEMLCFFPRVCYGNIVLSPATWRLSQQHFASLQTATETNQQEKIGQFIAEWNLPVDFLLCDGDNHLPVFSQNHLSVTAFLDTIKQKPAIQLQEFGAGFNPANANCTRQYIACVTQEATVYHGTPKEIPIVAEKQRSFVPATEWIYYKLYCSEKQADRLLLHFVHPLVKEVNQKKLANKWFFIRYRDPDFHIRLRFHCTGPRCIPQIMALFNKKQEALAPAPGFWKTQLDTYTRELERYGRQSITNAETIFCIDSEAVLSMLHHKQSPIDPWFPICWLLKAIDDMLEAFSIPLQQKQILLQSIRNDFAREFNEGKHTTRQLDSIWRSIRQKSEALLNSDKEVWTNDLTNPLHKRFLALRQEAAKLRNLQQQNLLEKNIEELLRSFMHMSCNRVFASQARRQEFFVYDFLCRYYRSRVIRTSEPS